MRRWRGTGRQPCVPRRPEFRRRRCTAHSTSAPRKIDHRLRQRQVPFRHAEKIHGVASSHALRQRVGICQADVLYRHPHHSACDVEWIFAGFEHAAQPIERRIGIAVTHRFVQRGNKVVMLFTGFVVTQYSLLQGVLDQFVGNFSADFFGIAPSRQRCGHFQIRCRRAGRRHWNRRRFFSRHRRRPSTSSRPGHVLRPTERASATRQSVFP